MAEKAIPPRRVPTLRRAPTQSSVRSTTPQPTGRSPWGMNRQCSKRWSANSAPPISVSTSRAVRNRSVEQVTGVEPEPRREMPVPAVATVGSQRKTPPTLSTRCTWRTARGLSSMCSNAPTHKTTSTEPSSTVANSSAASTRSEIRARHGERSACRQATRTISGDTSIPCACPNLPASGSRWMAVPQPISISPSAAGVSARLRVAAPIRPRRCPRSSPPPCVRVLYPLQRGQDGGGGGEALTPTAAPQAC